MTILSASSGNGRCNAFASPHGARIQTSRSSSVVRITGIAFGWIGSTTAFGDVARKHVDEVRVGDGLGLQHDGSLPFPSERTCIIAACMSALRQKRPLRAATARRNVSSATTIFFWLNDTSRAQQMVRPDAGSGARELFNHRQGRRMFETARLACLRGGSGDDRFLLSAKA